MNVSKDVNQFEFHTVTTTATDTATGAAPDDIQMRKKSTRNQQLFAQMNVDCRVTSLSITYAHTHTVFFNSIRIKWKLTHINKLE